MKELISPARTLGFPPIFIDYLSGAESARHLYFGTSPESVAERLDSISYDRAFMVNILTEQNRRFQAAPPTFANIEKLEDPRTLCVFSGQQAVLFGGPLLIVLKAIALAKLAEKLSKQLSRPVVPVFWVAGDDHDFAEVNHTWLLNRSGEPVKISYDTPPAQPVSIGEVTFTDRAALEKAKQSVFEALGQSEFTPAIQEIIEKAYAPGRLMTDAFAVLMASLTQSLGVIYFCPTDDRVKQHAVPFFNSIINRQTELHQMELDTNREIIRSGYHVQAEKSEDAAHLFYSSNGRVPIHNNDNGFTTVNEHWTVDELLVRITSEPQKFSADVITRPILQSYLFPVVSQIGGPSEIAYLAQVNPLFTLFNLVPPYYTPRPSGTFVEARFVKLMQEYKIKFADLTGDIETIINRVLAESFPKELESNWKQVVENVNAQFDQFSETSLQFDPSLKEFAKQVKGKVEFSMKTFEEKLFSSHKKKSKDVRERIYRLNHALFMNHAPQERSLNITYFLARYGISFIDFIYQQIELDQPAHQVIPLTTGENK